MSSVSIEEARAKLSELIHELHPGDEVVITEGEQPVPIAHRAGEGHQAGCGD
jgi:antitoxin (DNA-binding transcriptional repressor) of toxin-antitoxin stability system